MEMVKNIALAVEAGAKTPPENWMVVVMGVGVVFVGLILIIMICKIMGLFFARSAKVEAKASAQTASKEVKNTVIENRQEIIAAVCAACAEDMGTDISALRVVSFKKI